MTHDRLAGIVILVVTGAIMVVSVSFRSVFPADPLGPRAFPLVSAVLMGLGAAWITFRPTSRTTDRVSNSVWLAVVSFVGYALLLEPLGFFVATVLAFVALSLLFGGRPVRSVLGGVVLVAALYLLFVEALGLVLPVGSLFVIGG